MKPVNSFHIGDREVGGDAPTFIIAELSANHGGKLETALATIEMAAKCGADAIKLQTYTPDTLTLRSSSDRFVVRTKNEWGGRMLHDLYAEAMTPWEWHAELRDCAKACGLILFSTPFDPTAVEFLEDLDVPAHKVASFELVDLPLVERVARTGKPMILSTGMASLGEIEAAVATCRSAGNDNLALLRCVSAYPAKPESMDLASLPTLASFGTVVGLSDHTREPTAAIVAVALGAKVLEKHFILRRDVGGPDAFFSLEPDELRATVKAVRDAEAALGRPRFGVAEEEIPSLAFRRSLSIARDVPAGKILDCDDVRSVRPAGGLAPAHLPAVLGRRASRALSLGEPVDWDLLGDRADVQGVALHLRDSTEKRLDFDVEVDGRRIGKIAFDDRGAGSWQLNVELSSLEDGARVVAAAEAEARLRGMQRLEAALVPTDEASIQAFKRAGFYAFATSRRGREALVRCERRLRKF